MKSIILVMVTVAFGTANLALAQEAGFGNDPNASKNQVPAPSVLNPADPQAGNPGSAAQVPTAPQKQDDLYDSGASGASTGEAGIGAPEAGFGGDPNASKNQTPAPSVNNPADPAAGNPGTAAQIPTAPQKQEDLSSP